MAQESISANEIFMSSLAKKSNEDRLKNKDEIHESESAALIIGMAQLAEADPPAAACQQGGIEAASR